MAQGALVLTVDNHQTHYSSLFKIVGQVNGLHELYACIVCQVARHTQDVDLWQNRNRPIGYRESTQLVEVAPSGVQGNIGRTDDNWWHTGIRIRHIVHRIKGADLGEVA